MRRGQTLEIRFWNKVRKSEGCWNWVGSLCGFGYGQIWVDGRLQKAHRISWILHYGQIPEELFVLHKCDNPPCVNPTHLFLGSLSDNIKDCARKKRLNTVKLIMTEVHQIRDWLKLGLMTEVQIAQHFGLYRGTVNRIKRNKTWVEAEYERLPETVVEEARG